MFNLFAKKPLLDDEAVEWLFDGFHWAHRHFDSDYFHQHSILVIPDNSHFPGRANSVHGIASLIFEQVKRYAGMSHWPITLLEPGTCPIPNTEEVIIEQPLRGNDLPTSANNGNNRLYLDYTPAQINEPEALIASIAHGLAHYLGQMADEPPPGGIDYWPHATELLAIYMGFGLMFANSSFTYKGGGCASCHVPGSDRHSFLSPEEATYALAIFTVSKQISVRDVTPHLKSHLRGIFKRAVKEINNSGRNLETRAGNNSIIEP